MGRKYKKEKEFIKNIKICEDYKVEVRKIVKEINRDYKKGAISYKERNKLIGKYRINDFIKYYNDFIKYYRVKLEELK